MAVPGAGPSASRIAGLVTGAADLLASSLTPATASVYDRYWCKFLGFCSSFNPAIPVVSTSSVALFISHLVSPPTPLAPLAPSSVASILSALSYRFKLLSLEDPCNTFVIKKIMAGLMKSQPSSDCRIPISISMLSELIIAARNRSNSPYQRVLFPAMFAFMFHALLRIGEVTESPHNLQFSSISIQDSSIHLVFSSFKHSSGPKTLILPTSKEDICPASLMREFLVLRGSDQGPLFCLADLSPISPALFRSFLRTSAAGAGFSDLHITPHSFRIGGATHAVSTGASSQQVQALGRWKSSAFLKYIRIPNFQLKP